MKKQIGLLMAGAMAFGSMSGCGVEETAKERGTETAKASEAEWFAETGYPIITDAAQMPKIEVFKSIGDLEPEDPNENLWMQQATEETGVTFQWTTVLRSVFP